MNCHKIRRNVLLMGSGELRGRRRKRVEAHLRKCPSCAAYQREAERLTALGRLSRDAVDGPSPFALTRILAHAREATDRPPVLAGRPVIRAACATLLLLGAAWWAVFPDGKSSGSADGGREMHALVEIMTTLENTRTGVPAAADDEEDLRALAERLLDLQGFAEEEVSVEEWWGPATTVPQSRSTPGFSARIRV